MVDAGARRSDAVHDALAGRRWRATVLSRRAAGSDRAGWGGWVMAQAIFIAVWAAIGASGFIWSLRVSLKADYAERVRRHDITLMAFLPWLLSGYAGLAITLFVFP